MSISKQELLMAGVATKEEVERVYEAIFQAAYSLSDFQEKELTSANMHLWKDLLLVVRTEKVEQTGMKWARFNFLDYVWLKILLYLTDMKISKADKVDNIKQCLGKVASISPAELSIQTGVSDDKERSKAIINRSAYDGLSHIVAHSLLTKTTYHIRSFRKGICTLLQDTGAIAVYRPEFATESDTFIQLALTDIFTDFVYTMLMANRGKDPMELGIVTNAEGTLLGQLNAKIVTDLTIKFKGKKPESWAVKGGFSNELAHRLARCMVLGDYQKITYQLMGGANVSFLNSSPKKV